MKILKRENWWAWLLLHIGSQGTSIFVLGALLGIYKKDSWYAKWKTWVIPLIIWFVMCILTLPSGIINISIIEIIGTMFFPTMIMYLVFYIQVLCLVSAKLNVPGKELYLSSYIWLLCLIIPIIGWIMLIVMSIYLEVWPLVMLYRGEGERYINS